MIIPTAEYDPLFAIDGVPFQQKMLDYIHREFADILDSRIGLQQSETLQALADHQLSSEEGAAGQRRAA